MRKIRRKLTLVAADRRRFNDMEADELNELLSGLIVALESGKRFRVIFKRTGTPANNLSTAKVKCTITIEFEV